MDPLSITASVAGLYVAAVQVSSLLQIFITNVQEAPESARRILTEAENTAVVLEQLQKYVLGAQVAPTSQASFISLEQIVVVLTDCVLIFSELERILEIFNNDQPIRIIDRFRWVQKEPGILKLLTRLQSSKVSLNLMLATLTCASVDETNASVRYLTGLVSKVLESNNDIARRLRNLDPSSSQLATSTSNSHCAGIEITETIEIKVTNETVTFEKEFEKDLHKSRVYGRAAVRPQSLAPSEVSVGWSCLSGLSLSDVSHISVLTLPISVQELWNQHRYNQLPDAGVNRLSAWYNPVNRSAFIRSFPKNNQGEIVNQYDEFNSTGRPVYTTVSARNYSVMPASDEEMNDGYWTMFRTQIELKEK